MVSVSMLLLSVVLSLVPVVVVVALFAMIGRTKEGVIGLFHPSCDGFGGGERVLWALVAALLREQEYSKYRIVVYARQGVVAREVLDKVKVQFDIDFSKEEVKRIEFKELTTWRWLEAKRYPHFTLIAQSLGSTLVAFEALLTDPPEIFVDTVGFAFTYPV
ncbi:hypothetical protein HDU98_002589 [Podochytrium sp. JEL0797]|nr:hypothetical protein HDU98_002589 [Podochytrium sp. JEL0797]